VTARFADPLPSVATSTVSYMCERVSVVTISTNRGFPENLAGSVPTHGFRGGDTRELFPTA